MNNLLEYSIVAIVASLMGAILTVLPMRRITDLEHQADIVSRGYGYYEANPTNGTVTFHWKTNIVHQ